MSQHSGLDAERWSQFDLDSQILMIGNEMNRATRWVDAGRLDALRRGYERVLRLTDLTVACHRRATLVRELLRWRDLVAALFVSDEPDRTRHADAFRALLRLSPVASKQIGALPGARRSRATDPASSSP